jgi:hypothetical protein
MGQFDSRQRHGGRARGFEREHRSTPLLDRAVVLLNDVVEVTAVTNHNRLPPTVFLAEQS